MIACFDTHLHPEPDAGTDWIPRALAAGVDRLLAVGGAPDENQLVLDLARRFPAHLRAAIGFGRHRATAGDDPAGLRESLQSPDAPLIRAIGEIGLDYHYEPHTAPAQRELFAAQLDLARQVRRPVIVHSREADADTLDLLREHARLWSGPADRIGVLHCFTGSAPFAQSLLDLGLYLSFSGIVTFANADPLRQVAARVPTDRLLVETDAPYLTPVPLRGRKNEPAFLPHVVDCLARVRGESAPALAAATRTNALALFGWDF